MDRWMDVLYWSLSVNFGSHELISSRNQPNHCHNVQIKPTRMVFSVDLDPVLLSFGLDSFKT